jgi:hypothetical protein
MVMLAIDLIKWWYSTGWGELINRLRTLLRKVVVTFSVPILLRTLFAPWRRIITYGDESFIAGLKAALDNTVSRFVGFGVRIVVLITALISVAIITSIGVISVVIWPLMPILGIALIAKGLLG